MTLFCFFFWAGFWMAALKSLSVPSSIWICLMLVYLIIPSTPCTWMFSCVCQIILDWFCILPILCCKNWIFFKYLRICFLAGANLIGLKNCKNLWCGRQLKFKFTAVSLGSLLEVCSMYVRLSVDFWPNLYTEFGASCLQLSHFQCFFFTFQHLWLPQTWSSGSLPRRARKDLSVKAAFSWYRLESAFGLKALILKLLVETWAVKTQCHFLLPPVGFLPEPAYFGYSLVFSGSFKILSGAYLKW